MLKAEETKACKVYVVNMQHIQNSNSIWITHTFLTEMQSGTTILGRGLTPSYKINMQLQYVHTKSYTQIFTTALFVVASICSSQYLNS